jgi:hypothetical protein
LTPEEAEVALRELEEQHTTRAYADLEPDVTPTDKYGEV